VRRISLRNAFKNGQINLAHHCERTDNEASVARIRPDSCLQQIMNIGCWLTMLSTEQKASSWLLHNNSFVSCSPNDEVAWLVNSDDEMLRHANEGVSCLGTVLKVYNKVQGLVRSKQCLRCAFGFSQTQGGHPWAARFLGYAALDGSARKMWEQDLA